jgi:hypothetical protein
MNSWPAFGEILTADPGGCVPKAYLGKVAIYIPSVRHRIGIELDSVKSVGVTYMQGPDRFLRSIFSVPVLDFKGDAVAVIAVSSKRPRVFHRGRL